MTCERYWREGIVLVEQGVTDLHRESCEACRDAHAVRGALVAALPMVGEDAGRADWKARVWAEIDRGEARRGWVPWLVGGGFAFAAAAILVLVLVRRPPEHRPAQYATAITIEKGPIKKRGGAQVGDRVRAVLGEADEVRIYLANALVFQCGRANREDPTCQHDPRGRVAVYDLRVNGDFTIVIVSGKSVPVVGDMDRDLAALVEANVTYRIEQELSVR